MIIQLSPGMTMTPIRPIENARIRHWTYASECDDVGGGMLPGAELRVVQVNKIPGQMWVRVQIVAFDPPRHLKLSGEEFGLNFRVTAGR